MIGAITQLVAPVSATATQFALASTVGFGSAPFYVQIDSELILVGALTVALCSSLTRGASGTAAAAHAANANVTLMPSPSLPSWAPDVVEGASAVVKTSGGFLYELDVASHDGTNSPLYLLLFDAAALPVDGTAPSLFFPIPVVTNEKVSLSVTRQFVNGLCWCASSTAATKTLVAGAKLGVAVNFQ